MKKFFSIIIIFLLTNISIYAGHHKTDDIVEVAVKAGIFNTLVAAVKAADLVSAVKGDGPFTVFAPNDEAFNKLPSGTIESLLKKENKEKLRSILLYHVLSGKVEAESAVKLSSAKTLQGDALKLSFDGKTLKINDANVIKANIKATNGVIHVIDKVLIP